MGYKLSDLAIDTIKSLQSEVAGFGKGQDEEFKVLQEKISKVLEELKTHIDDIDFDDLNARLG